MIEYANEFMQIYDTQITWFFVGFFLCLSIETIGGK